MPLTEGCEAVRHVSQLSQISSQQTYLGSTWPTGAYSITTTGPNGTATASATVQSSSVAAASTIVRSPVFRSTVGLLARRETLADGLRVS